MAPEGAQLRPPAGHRAQFRFLLTLCFILRSKKWGPHGAASLVKGFSAPDILVRGPGPPLFECLVL